MRGTCSDHPSEAVSKWCANGVQMVIPEKASIASRRGKKQVVRVMVRQWRPVEMTCEVDIALSRLSALGKETIQQLKRDNMLIFKRDSSR